MNKYYYLIRKILTFILLLFPTSPLFAQNKTAIESGKALYQKLCASCHGKYRRGKTGPPLLPLFLKRSSDRKLMAQISQGIPGSQMPPFQLSPLQMKSLLQFLRTPAPSVKWTAREIRLSRTLALPKPTERPSSNPAATHLPKPTERPRPSKRPSSNPAATHLPKPTERPSSAPSKGEILERANHLKPPSLRKAREMRKAAERGELTAVVDRGNGKILIVSGTRLLDSFPFRDVHGGIKFARLRGKLYVPARTGWIGGYDYQKARYFGKVRPCLYLRNIALSRDERYLLAACWIPNQIVILDSSDFKLRAVLPLSHRLSAIYSLYTSDRAVFTFMTLAKWGSLDLKSFKITYYPLREPLRDFFIDPLDLYLVGTTRRGRALVVLDLETSREVFRSPLDSLPHLFSAAFWYREGKFFFAIPHLARKYATIWQLYRWKFAKKLPLPRPGIFVRTHPSTPYLWIDSASESLFLIDKSTLQLKKFTPLPGVKLIHTEFSGDGELAYISIYRKKGGVLISDSITLRERGQIPASFPMGKYNISNKSRRRQGELLGREVFFSRCWGCHHTTRQAFGPSLMEIARKRTPSEIRAQLLNPETIAKHLGYRRNAMPQIPLNGEEIRSLLLYIQSWRERKERN